MARTVRDTNLETRAARLRLDARRKPYWRVLESGLHLGYRRTKEGGGSWVARRFIGDGRYKRTKFGVADDLQDADGVTVLTFTDAQAKAREWWKAAERAGQGLAPDDGPYTVAKALEAYFAERERRGSKGLAKDRAAARARILPELGAVELAKLTTKRIRDWQSALATAPKLTRAPRIAKKPQEPRRRPDGRGRRAGAPRDGEPDAHGSEGGAQPRLSRRPRRVGRCMAQGEAVPRGGRAGCSLPLRRRMPADRERLRWRFPQHRQRRFGHGLPLWRVDPDARRRLQRRGGNNNRARVRSRANRATSC